MPSGAKKRKAAKKKLQKKATNSNYLGSDNDKAHDERDGGERESSEEPFVTNDVEVKEEVSLGKRNVAEFSEVEKIDENYSAVNVPVTAEEDCVRETKNGKHKRSSSSSSSSSSENDQAVVEEEKSVVVDAGKMEQQVPSLVSEPTRENPVITEVACSSVEESIPVEELVKNVVSMPHESNVQNESEASENPVVSYDVESERKEKADAVVPSADEKHNISSGVSNFVEEKTEAKVIQVVYEGFVDMKPRDGESLYPQSSGVTSIDASCGDNHVKESETHKYVEDKPLISSAPLPVQRTSWTNCCGLFEVFSGGTGCGR